MPSSSTTTRRRQGAHLPADHPGRIIYADPRSLPSYPSVGVKLDSKNSAALQAATLTKSPAAIVDKNAPINPASLKAATAAAAASAALSSSSRPASALRTAPVAAPSNPPLSPRPAQRRSHQRIRSEPANGQVASRSASSMSTRPPVDTSTWGNSAATQAFRNNRIAVANNASAPPEKPIPEIAALGHEPSLRAAKGAMRSVNASNASLRSSAYGAPGPSLRPRHVSASASASSLGHKKSFSSHYPEGVSPGQAFTSAANALKAATAATKARSGDRSSFYSEAGSVPYTNMNRQMYTSHPSVGPEHSEQAHEKMLHASALAMAKRMYNPQADGSTGAASSGTTQGTSLQEAAYKLAQERLEKLHEKYEKDREYRDHYVDPNMGSGGASSSTTRRFSMRGRLRRQRSSSDLDEEASQDIRNEISQLSSKIAISEEKKRQDRKSVLLAAQRNVKSQLHDIDEKVYSDSGRVPPATLSSWEGKAHSVAQARADAQLSKYPRADQVDIGGGKFINRTDVDKIATRRVQPVIDDIHEKAQAEYERQAVERQEQDDRKAEATMRKTQDKELKEMRQKLKQEEKNKKKAQKAEEKARKTENRGSKRKSFFLSKANAKPVAAVAVPAAAVSAAHESDSEVDDVEDTDSEVMTAPDTSSSVHGAHDAESETPTTDVEHATSAAAPTSKAVSPVSPTSPVPPESSATRTNLAVPAAVVTTAAVVPAAVSRRSFSRPVSTKSSTVTAPTSPAAAPATPSESAPAAFTEPRAAPSVPTSPSTISVAAAAPAASTVSAGPRPANGATDKPRPVSVKSAGSSSPKSKSKIRSWLKTKFARPRPATAASAAGAGPAEVDSKAAAPKSTGPDATTEKSFAGGHALKSAETDSARNGFGVKGTTTGNLSLPAIGGIAGGFAAGTDAAATAAIDKVPGLGNLTTITSASNSGGGTAAPSTEERTPGLLDTTGQSKAAEATGAGVASVARKPVSAEASGSAAASDEPTSTTKMAAAPAAKPSMLEPFAAVPGATSGVDAVESTTGKETGAVPGVAASEAATDKGPATTNEPGASGIKTFTSDLKNSAVARASSPSSAYSTDGAAGARGGGLGSVGTKNVDEKDVDEPSTFVTVAPPTAAPLEGTSATILGESDPAYTHLPPQTLRESASKKSTSPSRDSRFLENLEDHF